MRGTQVIYSINPVAKLSAAFLLSFVLILTIDWLSATVALVLESVLFAWVGLSRRQFFVRTLPIWFAAPAAALTTLLYGQPSGQTYVSLGFLHVTDGSISLAIATALRVLAIGLPAVVLFVTIDPTDLADGLAQVWHLPSRFVLGALAGLRLVGLFIDDWRSLELARRARGVGTEAASGGCSLRPSLCSCSRSGGAQNWRRRWRPEHSGAIRRERGRGNPGSAGARPF